MFFVRQHLLPKSVYSVASSWLIAGAPPLRRRELRAQADKEVMETFGQALLI